MTVTHRMSKTPVYLVWQAMLNRCRNPNVARFQNHGGRGITVCERWRKSFEAFCEDMGPRPDGFTLERADNDAGYSPENCRWASQKEQQRNRRDTVFYTIDGIRKPFQEWCDQYKIKRLTARRRITHLGWSIKDAITTPTLPIGNKRAHGIRRA